MGVAMKIWTVAFLVALIAMGFAFRAGAQPVIPGCPTPGSISCQAIQAFTPVAATATLSASTSSSRVALPGSTAGLNTVVVNGGLVPVFIVLGDVTATATTASTKVVAPGVPIVLPQGTATYLAGITGSSTATLTIYSGTGWPNIPITPPISVTATATTTATAAATPPTVSAGPDNPLIIDLHSALFVQPTFAGQPVDGTHGLPVNCIVGCSGGPADESTFTPGTTSVITGGFFQTTATANALTNGQAGSVQLTANRAFFVNLRNASGAELGIAAAPLQVSLANTAANATAVKVDGSAVTQPVSGTVGVAPITSGGLSVYFVQPTASDNHANIKNGAGQVYHIKATNNSATVNYLRLYNAGTGFNGCNSATNLVDQWAIPANTSGAGFVEDISLGAAFATGISICVTSGYATTDTTSATASAMSVSIGYK